MRQHVLLSVLLLDGTFAALSAALALVALTAALAAVLAFLETLSLHFVIVRDAAAALSAHLPIQPAQTEKGGSSYSLDSAPLHRAPDIA